MIERPMKLSAQKQQVHLLELHIEVHKVNS